MFSDKFRPAKDTRSNSFVSDARGIFIKKSVFYLEAIENFLLLKQLSVKR